MSPRLLWFSMWSPASHSVWEGCGTIRRWCLFGKAVKLMEGGSWYLVDWPLPACLLLPGCRGNVIIHLTLLGSQLLYHDRLYLLNYKPKQTFLLISCFSSDI